MPTPEQIERARLVSLWRKATRYMQSDPPMRFHDYDPVDVMDGTAHGWPLEDFWEGGWLRPDQYAPNLPVGNATIGRTRIISNPPRRQQGLTRPDVELPDDFPY
jgi:hypothetical protein